MEIRAARLPEEEAALTRFVQELQHVERAFEPNRRIDPDIGAEYFRVLMKRVAEEDGRVFVAEEEGEIAGWMVTLVEQSPIFIIQEERCAPIVSELFVAEGARGRGIGRALLQAAERDFKARGFGHMMIGVLAGNIRARSMYEKFGFSPYAEIRRKRF